MEQAQTQSNSLIDRLASLTRSVRTNAFVSFVLAGLVGALTVRLFAVEERIRTLEYRPTTGEANGSCAEQDHDHWKSEETGYEEQDPEDHDHGPVRVARSSSQEYGDAPEGMTEREGESSDGSAAPSSDLIADQPGQPGVVSRPAVQQTPAEYDTDVEEDEEPPQ